MRSCDYRELSFWLDAVPDSLTPRPSLTGTRAIDVAIVGAGFTGLWTAYHLLSATTDLRVALVEAEIAGFGASGRNGGWCSSLYPVPIGTLAREVGTDDAQRQYLALRASAEAVPAIAAAEDIDVCAAHTGAVILARSPAELRRVRHDAENGDRFGLDFDLLDGPSATALVQASDTLGAVYTPHCGVLDPARLVRGLARAVEQRGGVIYERSKVLDLRRGAVSTAAGTLTADTVVRATEGYSATLPTARRQLLPMTSFVLATEPLPDRVWDDVGMARREAVADHRRNLAYAQRTADGRMVFGGRAPHYHFGSRTVARYPRRPEFTALQEAMTSMFPPLRGTRVTHRWGGPIGVARDWHASVGLQDGIGWAGGYVGDGVATSHLAGKTLSDLILQRTTPETKLPWVGHRSAQWEPEPLRTLGVAAATRALGWLDRREAAGRRPEILARLLDSLVPA